MGEGLSNTETDILKSMENIVNIRKFTSQMEVEQSKLQLLYKSFSFGPSLANQQPWELLELERKQIKKIAALTLDPFFTEGSEGAQAWLVDTPHVFLILNDRRRSEARIGKKIGKDVATQDSFAALQNLRILAQLMGLGTSVIREFHGEKVQEALAIPKVLLPVALVAVGYPSSEPEIPPRFNVTDFVHKGGVEEW